MKKKVFTGYIAETEFRDFIEGEMRKLKKYHKEQVNSVRTRYEMPNLAKIKLEILSTSNATDYNLDVDPEDSEGSWLADFPISMRDDIGLNGYSNDGIDCSIERFKAA